MRISERQSQDESRMKHLESTNLLQKCLRQLKTEGEEEQQLWTAKHLHAMGHWQSK